jgi:hypothetical protein
MCSQELWPLGHRGGHCCCCCCYYYYYYYYYRSTALCLALAALHCLDPTYSWYDSLDGVWPLCEAFTYAQGRINTQIFMLWGIQTHNPNIPAGGDSSFPWPRGHCDQQNIDYYEYTIVGKLRFGATMSCYLMWTLRSRWRRRWAELAGWLGTINPDDGGDALLRNVSWYMDYMALHLRISSVNFVTTGVRASNLMKIVFRVYTIMYGLILGILCNKLITIAIHYTISMLRKICSTAELIGLKSSSM